jgi:FkbH-like protein
LFERGIRCTVQLSDYDTYLQDVLDEQSPLYQQPRQAVLLSLWFDTLPWIPDRDGCRAVLGQITTIVERLKEKTDALLILHTFLPPFCAVNANNNPALENLNHQILAMGESEERVVAVDLNAILQTLGAEKAFDYRYGFIFKSPLTHHFFRHWGNLIAQIVLELQGFLKKVLVLDCDNTLWGGIIGEDGIEGIKLDPSEYPGVAYYTFQKQLLQLEKQGVLLALCSKNNEPDVMEVLEKHPHCLIRPEKLAAWKINWQDKPSNLVALSEQLNLGIDSFVFIDDNPMECERVRTALPTVAVLQIPLSAHEMTGLLRDYTGFNRIRHTGEDSVRTAMYKTEQVRSHVAANFSNLDDYLASLELKVEIGPVRKEEWGRVAQLTQKTNQFNLSTKRYQVADIERLAASDLHRLLVLKVTDKFGDYGITGFAILEIRERHSILDTMLLSCRVLGRKIENVFFSEILLAFANAGNESEAIVEYVESAKNSQVREFLDKQQYAAKEQAGAKWRYRFSGGATAGKPDYIEIHRRS